MEKNTFLINCTNPFDYSNSLEEIGNKKHKLWNGVELAINAPNAKANCQIFIKNDLHFYRTDYEVGSNMLLKIKQEALDREYIDLRINHLGKSASIIKDKELQLHPAHKKEQSFHIFLRKEALGLQKEVLEKKRKNAHQCPHLSMISADILSIPATGSKNALKIEAKMLEFSYAYLDYLHAPITSPPSFLSCDYKLQCIHKTREILEDNFTNPPTIKKLSKQVGINSNQLKTGFKYLYGSTIRQFVINFRLDHAQRLIQNTQLPLGIICNKVGYTNHGHFSKLYKDKFGISPLNEREIQYR